MNIQRILHASLFCPTDDGWGQPILLWGAAGTGKTKSIRNLARRLQMPFQRLSPAERGEGQFGVVPVPQGGVLTYPSPAWAAQFDNGGVIFVDEISTAAPALQAPLLGLVQLRVLGDHQFSNRTRIIAAANETHEAAGGWDLAPPLLNRFGHLNYEGLSANAWGEGLVSRWQDPAETMIDAAAEEERVLAAWPQAHAQAAALISSFVIRHPALLHAQPKDPTTKAWPSRRSWTAATDALAASHVHGLTEDERNAYGAAFVGDPAWNELTSFAANLDLPDPVAVLDGKVAWAHNAARVDRTLVVLQSCAATVVNTTDAPVRKRRAIASWRLLESVIGDAADVAVPAMRALIRAGLVHGAVDRASDKVLSRLSQFTTAAGMQ